jgi:hypothetical protein
MSLRPGHAAVEELLGAYALDAVDPEERAAVDSHLRECPRCRSEVATHRETATFLVDAHLEPPTALWDRVAANLDDVAPPLDLSRYVPRTGRTPRGRSSWLAAAAAAVAIVLGVGALAHEQQQELGTVRNAAGEQELAVAALAAYAAPDARHATLRAGDGSLQLGAVVLPGGSGFLLADRLPALPDDRTYQLWGMVDGHAVSAGVLGSDPGVVAFQVGEGTSALAVSEETAGGAAQPTLPATLTGLVEA